MMQGNGQLSVPPGFRFHPTDEELLYYYLRKKVSYEAIDLDVIREIDLNKLEPWDLKDKCRIGSSCQNEWYFFSHKDKKYPTGTRTNRATTAGFWKATGRDKAIYLSNSKRIGMRKTLVFYIGRAPHGKKTDWIMHEYRLEDANVDVQDDGWVVCRVFKKKNLCKSPQPEASDHEERQQNINMKASEPPPLQLDPKQKLKAPYHDFTFDGSMHLPQLLSPDSICNPTFYAPAPLNNVDDIECSQNLLRLTSNGYGLHQPHNHQERFHGVEWSFLDKLLASHNNTSHHHHHQHAQSKFAAAPSQIMDLGSTSSQKYTLHQFAGCETDLMNNFLPQ